MSFEYLTRLHLEDSLINDDNFDLISLCSPNIQDLLLRECLNITEYGLERTINKMIYLKSIVLIDLYDDISYKFMNNVPIKLLPNIEFIDIRIQSEFISVSYFNN